MTKPEQRSTGRQARKPVGIGCTVVEQAEAVTGSEAETVAGTRHTHAHTQGRATGRDRPQRLQFLNVAAAASALSQHDNNNNNNDKYLCVSFRFHFAASYNELCCHTSLSLSAALPLSLPLSLSLSNCKQRVELKLSRSCAFTRLPLKAISAAKQQQQQHIGIHAQISQLSLCPSPSQRRLLPQPCPLFYDGKVKF